MASSCSAARGQESLSLLSLIDAATRGRGLKLEDHVFIARARAIHGLVLLFKRSPFTPRRSQKALAFVERNGMELVYAPGQMERALPEVKAFLTSSNRALLCGAGKGSRARDRRCAVLFPAVEVEPAARDVHGWAGQSAASSSPSRSCSGSSPSCFRSRELLLASHGSPRPRSSYFGMIGLGYIIVEMVLLVKFTFFLGHPTRSLTVTLFSLLLFSGVGALLSSRAKAETGRERLLAPLLGVALLDGGIRAAPAFAAVPGDGLAALGAGAGHRGTDCASGGDDGNAVAAGGDDAPSTKPGIGDLGVGHQRILFGARVGSCDHLRARDRVIAPRSSSARPCISPPCSRFADPPAEIQLAFLARVSGRRDAFAGGGPRSDLSVRRPCVAAVRLHAQKLPIDQRVEHRLAHHPFDAAQPLHLLACQTQPWHLEILSTETCEHVVSRSHDATLMIGT